MTKTSNRRALGALILACAGLAVLGVRAAVHTRPDPASSYVASEAMIPMRDGVRLHSVILRPKEAAEPLPFLISRTPYGVGTAKTAPQVMAGRPELAAEGYIFVFQDIRGKYGSEGTFVMLRPVRDRSDAKAIDESTDAYDTIAWLLANVPGNNGRAGVSGVSYDGWLTVMAMIDPHPALKAVSEQASPADMFLGDDFHHNGAFRLSYGFEYAAMMETGTTTINFKFDKPDTYDWYLDLGPLRNVNERWLHGRIPTWNDFVAHPNYDAFWRKQAVVPMLDGAKVPNLNVAGWFDQEDFDGPMKIYEALEKNDTAGMNFLVVGPWNHGGWGRPAGRRLGDIDFGSDTAVYYRERVLAPWFAYWLKDKGRLPFKEALTFQTGSNNWEESDAWPPRRDVSTRGLYFHAGRKLDFEPPKAPPVSSEQAAGAGATPTGAVGAFDEFVSDPGNPVPYRRRPIEPTYPGPGWPKWLVEDQRFVEARPDVLSWATAPLAADVTISGDITARLFASTTGSDCDWIVKLIDAYPETYPADAKMAGYELMVADEVLRGRFRESFEHPSPVKPGIVTPFVIDLHTNNHVFLKGHRIMVQVQSTWFPLIDRNPQKYVANIFEAEAADFTAATHRVYRSPEFASRVELPVVAGEVGRGK